MMEESGKLQSHIIIEQVLTKHDPVIGRPLHTFVNNILIRQKGVP